jgi:hypothetical protein
MKGISGVIASAALSSLLLVPTPPEAHAQQREPTPVVVGRVAAVAAGSIHGVVRDEHGAPVIGALVSALGVSTAFAKSDGNGRFELGSLQPGPYLIRAHRSGFLASHGQIVDVRPSGRTSSALELRRATDEPAPPRLLAASAGVPETTSDQPAVPVAPGSDRAGSASDRDDHSETAWRLRHLRRSILQNVTLAGATVADDSTPPRESGVASLFANAPFSGQLNLLTTASFDNPQQLFSGDNLPRSVTYLSVGAPIGDRADWIVRGALAQADISSWIVAGEYVTRSPARHRYDVGLSYATQRYDGGNPAALREVTDGSRNAGAVYGFDTFTITPAIVLTYGGRYARYDYLDGRSLLSPRASLSVSPGYRLRIHTLWSRRAVAPGAEEFLPPGDSGIWLPPQRTFSSLPGGDRLEAERSTHLELEVERDLGTSSTLSIRTFQQRVQDQLVTMFGVELPGLPPSDLGHYFVSTAGDVDTHGVGAGFRTAITPRIQGSVAYSVSRARWRPDHDGGLWSPASTTPSGSDRIHDVATAIETSVPETATRVVVLYRISNAFASRQAGDEALVGTRFDVQVHQSLPFMDFSSAKWEMLLGVRNFFRDAAADQSLYDELLVIRPPKRLVGGLAMRF